MTNSHENQLTSIVAKASKCLSDIDQIRKGLLAIPQTDEGGSFETQARTLQLILAYRLDTQDALVKLIDIDSHILYILGIQPKHSVKTNVERLSYALGTDDLKHVLHALNQLVDYLLRIAQRYQSQHQHRNQRKEVKETKLLKGMQKLVAQQKIFTAEIIELQLNIEQILKLEAIGPIHDHIAALRGPISQFYQAMLSGLTEAQRLYYVANKDPVLDHSLATLLNNADVVLKQIPSIFNPQPNHQLGQFATPTSEQLEERAAAKRTRPFFSP
jgi:hypothetical protein